jgi:hypothetical protein
LHQPHQGLIVRLICRDRGRSGGRSRHQTLTFPAGLIRFSPPCEPQTSRRPQPVSELAAALSDLAYVDAVLASDVNAIDE